MPRGLATKTLELIDEARVICDELAPITVRGIAYKLFTRGLLADMTEPSVDRLGRAVKTGRERGDIPWNAIVDEGRDIEKLPTWNDPAQFARSVQSQYRRDRWRDQPVRLLLMSEKGTVRGVLRPVLDAYGVGFLACHGYLSATTAKELADLSTADDRPYVVFYVGDFDPSGMHMSAVDLPRRFTEYGGIVDLRRIALVPDDLVGLPSFPAATKTKDSRYRWFTKSYGDRCYELDALDPTILRDRVREVIRAEIDWEPWDRAEIAERAEQASLKEVLSQWPTSPQNLFSGKPQNRLAVRP